MSSLRSLYRVKNICSSRFNMGVKRDFHHSQSLRATEGEERLACILKEKLDPTYLEVVDISGGCGSMYQISIDSDQFNGLRVLHQHRLVNEALGEEVKALHGLTLKTGKSARS